MAVEQVMVAVCTRQRPRSLARLLESLARHVPNVPVIVVDNDPAGSARTIVEASRIPARYVHEPKIGIPHARNAALEATPRSAVIAFVDDDETVGPGWLAALLSARQKTGAELVTGPVRVCYEDAVPRWVRHGGFFERPEYVDGTELEYAATNNLLMGPEVRAAGLRFDERLALTGGSDTLLACQARDQGLRIVWAANAVVTEHVPAWRAHVGWLCRRAYRMGTTLGALAVMEATAQERPSARAGKSVGQVVVGVAALVPWTVWRGRAGVVRALRLVCRGAGGLAGLAGRRYEEYASAR